MVSDMLASDMPARGEGEAWEYMFYSFLVSMVEMVHQNSPFQGRDAYSQLSRASVSQLWHTTTMWQAIKQSAS